MRELTAGNGANRVPRGRAVRATIDEFQARHPELFARPYVSASRYLMDA